MYQAENGLAEPRLPLALEPWLALRPAYLALALPDEAGPALHFYLEDPATGCSIAELLIQQSVPGFTHLKKPAFGRVQTAAGLPAAALHQLFGAAETALRERGQLALHVQGQPFSPDPAAAAQLAEVLRQRGYLVARADLHHYLNLTQPYADRLDATGQQHLAECQRAGLHLEQEPPFLLPLAYDFMQACGQEQGQQLAFSLARLQALFRQFPRAYSLFSVREPGGDWAALTVAVQENSQVLRAGVPAIPRRVLPLRPAVLLYQGLHAFGQASGLRVLDLGSANLTEPSEIALLPLKRDVGGVAGLRLSWEKALGEDKI